jgi:hypothetical protein
MFLPQIENQIRCFGRQTITMDVNKVMHSVSNLLPSKPKITSHSFRIGYISQLWKDTKTLNLFGKRLDIAA